MNNTGLSEMLAQSIMNRYPNPDLYPYKSWSYPQGFMLWGMIKLWENTENKKYYDYVMEYCNFHVNESGEISGFAGDSLDDIMAGSLLVWAYSQTGKEKFKTACAKIRRIFDSYPRSKEGAFWHAKSLADEVWVDGVFMGQMFLARYGKYIADREFCFGEAARQLILIKEYCEKNSSGLLLHAWSGNRKADWVCADNNCSPEVWSEGLGWYALILAEVLELYPEKHPEKGRLVHQLKLLLDSLKKHQDPNNGLWYQVVDKEDSPGNWNDTSGSAMFVYAVSKAMEMGYADRKTFGPVVEKGYKGILDKAKINSQGLVDIVDACDGLCVQKTYEAYIRHPRTVNAKEAVAAVLWASCQVEHRCTGHLNQQ